MRGGCFIWGLFRRGKSHTQDGLAVILLRFLGARICVLNGSRGDTCVWWYDHAHVLHIPPASVTALPASPSCPRALLAKHWSNPSLKPKLLISSGLFPWCSWQQYLRA